MAFVAFIAFPFDFGFADLPALTAPAGSANREPEQEKEPGLLVRQAIICPERVASPSKPNQTTHRVVLAGGDEGIGVNDKASPLGRLGGVAGPSVVLHCMPLTQKKLSVGQSCLTETVLASESYKQTWEFG